MINCITIFFTSTSSWGTESHRNAALERRDHWDTGTNPPRQVTIMWLPWEQGLEGKKDGGTGGGVGSNARTPAPILRKWRILNFINLTVPKLPLSRTLPPRILFHSDLSPRFGESHFLTERSNPVSPQDILRIPESHTVFWSNPEITRVPF